MTGMTAMTLIISETTMISDQSVHTARYVPERNARDVSRPPGHIPDRNTAITAMTLVNTAADRDVHKGIGSGLAP